MEEQTKILFTHKGLVPADECYEVCHDAWGMYTRKSLYHLITTGKGEPNPVLEEGFDKAFIDKWKNREL